MRESNCKLRRIEVNCLHETFFDAAIEDAKKLDEYFNSNKAPIGPLHGLPISLKDQFHVKGVETTMGYIGESSEDPEVVADLDALPQVGLEPFKAKKGLAVKRFLKVRW